jgi:hypothetical protein
MGMRRSHKQNYSNNWLIASTSLFLLHTLYTRKQGSCVCESKEENGMGVIHYEVCSPLSEEKFKQYMENVRRSHPDRPVFVLFMGK